MCIAAGQGQTTPGDKILMSTETSCHFSHLLQVSKNLFEVWFYTIFFMILYMYIHGAPGQGQTAPRGQSFNVNRNVLSFHSFDASFKNMPLKSDFIQFVLWFNTCIQPRGRGRQTPGDKIWMSTERHYHFTHLLQVSKKSLWSLILYIFFHDLIHVYSSRAGAYSPQGTKFWCQQKLLVTSVICC